LGLSITRKIIHKLGGTISVKSEVGKFAEFFVDLPYAGEIVDLTSYRKKLTDTTIFILDDIELVVSADSTEDEFMSLPYGIVEEAGLDVKRCSSWSELEDEIEKRQSSKKHAFLVQEHLLPAFGIDRINDMVSSSNCYWFNPGPAHRNNAHFRSYSGILPSILLDSIYNTLHFNPNGAGKKSYSLDTQPQKTLISSRPDCNLHSESISNELASQQSPLKKSTDNSKEEPTDSPYQESLKVLYAEDNIVNQNVLNRMLKQLGVTNITIVDNALKAVEMCETTKFDVIFIDMQMPVMDGLEACERIITSDAKERVVFVTAHALNDFKEKALGAGASAFISKPFDLQKI
jgi:CheY-like chemotaxis protein